MPEFGLPGALRRIRRTVDLSQRELAARLQLPQSAVAQAESGRRDLPVRVLQAAAALARLRLALLDEDGAVVPCMAEDAVQDGVGRRFPAHLDTRYGDDHWWHDPDRYSREQPWYTFDRSRGARDHHRQRHGTPVDHQRPQPGDSPAERRAHRQAEASRRRAEEARRRRDSAAPWRIPAWQCTCPAECEPLLLAGELVSPHVEECACRCDLG